MRCETATTGRNRRARLAGALTLAAAAGLVIPVVQGRAQDRPAAAAPSDPRVGLSGGLRNARAAARNMELVANVPKPRGFFDPKAPAGDATEPEKPEAPESTDSPAAPPATPPAESSSTPGALGFANSDLAFIGDRMIVGNFNGFNAYDIRNPGSPKLIVSVVCPGGQGDVSVHGNLLFMSVEQTRGRLDCGTGGVQATSSPDRFRGVRIFDITDLKKPTQIAAVQTCRGSHTHTLVTAPNDKANVYIYGSGTSTVRPGDELAGCSGLDPKEDLNTALFSIDVIQVPLADPAKAQIVNRPRIFADQKTGNIAGLWPGGNYGTGTQKSAVTNQCHDITVLPEAGLAAGACAGNGILLDISDPVHPVRLDHVADKNFAYWHSATFNNDGSKVLFTDEWGGGTRPRCRPTDLPNWGADAIFDIVDRKMTFQGYFKMPAPQTDQENCVAHNGSIIPVPGRDIMVQAWYQGGVSVFDFTDGAHPVEIAFFDRGPVDPARLITAGFWSSVLVQRPDLRDGDCPRRGRVQADAKRTPLAERNRCRQPGALRRIQRAAPASRDLAGDPGGGARLRRSARPEQSAHAGSCRGAEERRRAGRTCRIQQRPGSSRPDGRSGSRARDGRRRGNREGRRPAPLAGRDAQRPRNRGALKGLPRFALRNSFHISSATGLILPAQLIEEETCSRSVRAGPPAVSGGRPSSYFCFSPAPRTPSSTRRPCLAPSAIRRRPSFPERPSP